MRSPVALILLGAIALILPAQALSDDDMRMGGHARVVEVVDGDTVVLETGVAVRLVGIQAPKLALGREGFVDWPQAGGAQAALAAMVQDRTVALYYGGREFDRYGRALAHQFRDDGLWIQGEMLRLGLARVYSFRDNRARLPAMLAIEAEARARGQGVWADPYYRILNPQEAETYLDSFQLVEGLVVSAAVVNGRGYLNFGSDWRTDFTISIAPADLRDFESEGLDITLWEGHLIRVRGWLKSFNGAMIEATHPEQIEVID